jgi:hypothetical protein
MERGIGKGTKFLPQTYSLRLSFGRCNQTKKLPPSSRRSLLIITKKLIILKLAIQFLPGWFSS